MLKPKSLSFQHLSLPLILHLYIQLLTGYHGMSNGHFMLMSKSKFLFLSNPNYFSNIVPPEEIPSFQTLRPKSIQKLFGSTFQNIPRIWSISILVLLLHCPSCIRLLLTLLQQPPNFLNFIHVTFLYNTVQYLLKLKYNSHTIQFTILKYKISSFQHIHKLVQILPLIPFF